MPNVLTAMYKLKEEELLSESDLKEELERFFWMYKQLLSHSEHAEKYVRVKMIKYDGKSSFISMHLFPSLTYFVIKCWRNVATLSCLSVMLLCLLYIFWTSGGFYR